MLVWLDKAFLRNFGTLIDGADFLLQRIPDHIPFEITTNGGSDFSENDTSVTLQGTGWIDVRKIVWRDQAIDVTWMDGESWSIEIPLQLGDE